MTAQMLALTLLVASIDQRIDRTPQDCVSNPAQVVDDVYQQVLERPAGPASAGMTDALAAGRMTVRDIVARVARSEEHTERFFWRPIVSEVYRQVLARDPTEDELRTGAAMLAAGRTTLPGLIADAATRAANNEEEAVRILYARLLGREPDAAGLQAFTDLARHKGIDAVAREIVASPEYRRRAGAGGLPSEDMTVYEAAVGSLYTHLLGREPDSEGLRSLARVAARQGVGAVIDRLLTSPEYERLYGSNGVPGRDVRYCGSK